MVAGVLCLTARPGAPARCVSWRGTRSTRRILETRGAAWWRLRRVSPLLYVRLKQRMPDDSSNRFLCTRLALFVFSVLVFSCFRPPARVGLELKTVSSTFSSLLLSSPIAWYAYPTTGRPTKQPPHSSNPRAPAPPPVVSRRTISRAPKINDVFPDRNQDGPVPRGCRGGPVARSQAAVRHREDEDLASRRHRYRGEGERERERGPTASSSTRPGE